jgi:hypothetical protein
MGRLADSDVGLRLDHCRTHESIRRGALISRISATLVLAVVREACHPRLRLSSLRHDAVITDSRRESIQIAENYQT